MAWFTHWLGRFAPAGGSGAGKSNRRRAIRPSLEVLEDRLVLSGDTSSLPVVIGGYPAAGATHLYLNFDGGTLVDGSDKISVTSQNLSDQVIQDVLYRTSEIFAPFNVEVTRMSGSGNLDTSGDGGTTVFIGNNPNGFTYTSSNDTDYPGPSRGVGHRPNSDSNDVAFEQPNSSNGGSTNTPVTIVRALAHEAGHTFGLAHVRSDLLNGQFATDAAGDPGLALGTVGDLMSYNSTGPAHSFFAKQSLPLTLYNFNPSQNGDVYDSSEVVEYIDSKGVIYVPFTQNSFLYLQEVLGAHPSETTFSVADSNAVDPSVQSTYVPQNDTLLSGDYFITKNATIGRVGAYNVERWTAPANETIKIDVQATGTKSLNPVLFVYDSSNNLDLYSDSISSNGSLQVKANQTYYIVVGGQDGQSTGDYQLNIVQETHSFFLTLDSIVDHIQGQGLGISTYVLMDGGLASYYGSNSYYETKIGAPAGTVKMEIDVIRTAPPVQYVVGGSQTVDGQTITEITEKGGAPAGVQVGLVRIVYLTYNVVNQTFTGNTSDGVNFSGQAGLAITVAGSSSNYPDVTFTVSTDNPVAPTTGYLVSRLTDTSIGLLGIVVSGQTGSTGTLASILGHLPIQLTATIGGLKYNPLTRRFEETLILTNSSRTPFRQGSLANDILQSGQSETLVLDFQNTFSGLTASIASILAGSHP